MRAPRRRTSASSGGSTCPTEGITLRVADPPAVAGRWGRVLGVDVVEPDRPTPGLDQGVLGSGGGHLFLALDGGEVAFAPAGDQGEGLFEIAVAIPPEIRRGRDTLEIGGVRFAMRDV